MNFYRISHHIGLIAAALSIGHENFQGATFLLLLSVFCWLLWKEKQITGVSKGLILFQYDKEGNLKKAFWDGKQVRVEVVEE